jgi:SpoOM protein
VIGAATIVIINSSITRSIGRTPHPGRSRPPASLTLAHPTSTPRKMKQRRQGKSVADEDDETPDSGSVQGYRVAPEGPSIKPPPEGELLEPTPSEQGALLAKRAQERNRFIGMIIGVGILVRSAVALADMHPPQSPLLIGLLVLVATALAVYTLWSFLIPRGPGPMIVRVEPRGEIAAGHSLAVTVLIQPRQDLELDSLQVRLVARRAVDGRKRPETTTFAAGVLASKQTIEAGQAVRLQTTLLVPQEAPPTSQKRGVTWRVEVSIGEPAVFTHGVPIRVLPLEKRLRERAERMKARGPARSS